ncbi:Mbeg1-like protein [Neobacillus sp. PS2-9]|uniref:Mbeg1-like protein n=1 Tax=Neobacillus sp. PS2-9 TaxID=3070676 RepID=UPI0027E08B4E|nr:Mbeg1-like protein [Neobacillus sp. PS2-9]WML60555.1 DUF2974 domain-containing protein [Neobacillus sp. PS2-9]
MPLELTEIDQLILAYIVYFDLSEKQKHAAINGTLTIGQLMKDNEAVLKDLKDFRPKFKTVAEFEHFQSIILSISDPKSKYYYWKIKDVDDQNTKTGFVAYTFEPLEGQAIMTFRGSEDMNNLNHFNTDWTNNFNTITSPLTIQQGKAIDYLNTNGPKYGSISLIGHSLGGNIAIAATVGASKEIRDKITNTTTFNAPGFNQTFQLSHRDEFHEMKSRIKELQNEKDYVSSILYNPTTPIIIEATVDDLTDNHFVHFMANDGVNLKRKVPQKKDFTTQWIHNMTIDLEVLPDPMLEGLINTVVALKNMRIDYGGLIKAGLIMFVISPQATIAYAGVLVGTAALFAGAIVVGGIIVAAVALAQTVIPIVVEEVSKFVSAVYNKVVGMVNYVIDGLVHTAVAAGKAIHDFSKAVSETISNVFSSLSNSIQKLWNSWFNPTYYLPINVDIYRLRNMAVQLQSIQNRLNTIDRRIDSLYTISDIIGSLKLLFNDWGIGNDGNIQNCINYINLAADGIENCERKLLNRAYSM